MTRAPDIERDECGRRQMVFDNGEIDAAALEKPRDAPGFPQIAADARIRNRRDLEALEGLIHRRANDQGRAPISAVNDEVADAKFDRRGKPRPEMRIAQHDIGNFRLARHRHIRKSGRARPAARPRPYTEGSGRTIERAICRARRILLERAADKGPIGRMLVAKARAKGARPSHDLIRTNQPLTHIGADGEARMVDVSDKAATERVAIAEGRVRMAALRRWPRSSPATPKRATSSARRGSPASWRPRRPPTSFRSAMA